MKNVLILVFLIITSISHSQIIEPVKWKTEVEKISDLEYDLIISAEIDAKYHIYSQKTPKGGPLPTVFIFEQNENYELIGDMLEDKGHLVNDPVFKVEVKYFDTKATFKQRVKTKNKNHFKILGEIEFTACNDSNCVVGYDDFEFNI